jgi:hypothetical protein
VSKSSLQGRASLSLSHNILNDSPQCYNRRLFSNTLQSGTGAAINTNPNSIIEIEFSEFTNNRASVGGAIYNLGTAYVAESTFMDNYAETAVRKFDYMYLLLIKPSPDTDFWSHCRVVLSLAVIFPSRS